MKIEHKSEAYHTGSACESDCSKEGYETSNDHCGSDL